ncbi:MAG TPA: NUDIX hydrolase [Candidatus Limnocylindria bacterium]|nr:NUDIX hydrolase [Candidatus Limnocylindria bacterium]
MTDRRDAPYERVRVVCLRGNLLLLVQHRWHDGSFFWLLPGGGIKDGETIEDTAVREVWEEAGVRIRVLRQLERPAAVTGAGPEHAFVLAEPLNDETLGPQPAVDGDAVFAVEWHAISPSSPIGGLTPEFWAPLGPLLLRVARDAS